MSTGVAFFDVDETVISLKSMESFLAFYFGSGGAPGGAEMLERLAEEAAGPNRANANQLYYDMWRGQSIADVNAAGLAWFAVAVASPGFFREETLLRLNRHVSRGDRIVLVSGSFDACLAPIAESVGAAAVLSTGLEVEAGVLTGRITRPMIGHAKGAAVVDYLADAAADPELTWGYGDHPSDISLLESVANPVVVGDNPALVGLADARGWQRLTIENAESL